MMIDGVMNITNAFNITRNGEELADSLVKLCRVDLVIALLAVSAHYGIDRTEAAIKRTYTAEFSDKIIGAMNLAAASVTRA